MLSGGSISQGKLGFSHKFWSRLSSPMYFTGKETQIQRSKVLALQPNQMVGQGKLECSAPE